MPYSDSVDMRNEGKTHFEPSRPKGSTAQILLERPDLRIIYRLSPSERVAQLRL